MQCPAAHDRWLPSIEPLARRRPGPGCGQGQPWAAHGRTRFGPALTVAPGPVPRGRNPDRAILLSATDNLVKGASGQALQNMNVMLGLQETAGLEQPALFP